MRTIRAIYRDGALKPLEPLDLPENAAVTVTVLEGDDVAAGAIADVGRTGGAYQFLEDAREDIYSPSDGEDI